MGLTQPHFAIRLCERYSYSVVWDTKRRQFKATVAEFPDLSVHNDDQILALCELRTQVLENLVSRDVNGQMKGVPEPPGGLEDEDAVRGDNVTQLFDRD